MIILDTSFIVSYYNTRDDNHSRALEIMESIKDKNLHITDYIFGECVTVVFVRLKNLKKTVEIGETIKVITKSIKIENDAFELGWDFFKKQKKTKFSFTDCTTLSTMKTKNIKNIATFDEDFKKAKGINVIS